MPFKTHMALLVVGICAVADIKSGQDDTTPPVSVTSFRPDNVIGHLGVPLGTVVRVRGICIDGDTTRRKKYAGITLLQIETVNGERLESPFLVPFGRAARELETPVRGQRFDYYVHEHGSFDGVVELPQELETTSPIVANDGFYYRPQVTVWKSNATESSRSQRVSERRKR
jgi:hypothetical protein